MKRPSRPDMTGPLRPYAVGFEDELTALCYSPWTVSAQLYLMSHLSRWLEERRIVPAELDAAVVERFLADRRRDHVRRLTPRGLAPLVGYLRSIGVVCEVAEGEAADQSGRLLWQFATYLSDERGLASRTIVGYGNVARAFLDSCARESMATGVVTAETIDAFLLARCAHSSVGTASRVVAALRALLRFLYLYGHVASAFDECVPRVAGWREVGTPRAVEPGDVRRLLSSCDRRSATGRRDFAILTLLARLGLRANEVAILSVDDIDWRAGTLIVTGKGGRRDRLPLPPDVGKPLADYCLRGRPLNSHRDLFLQARAPYGPITAAVVSHVVAEACRRSGLRPIGPHRLRHTTATAMRQAGAPLFEIGQILRHRFVMSTALYAKDDLAALAAIARPWPGARP